MHNKWTDSPYLPVFRKTLSELQHMLQPSSVQLSLLKPFFHHTWLLLLQMGAISVLCCAKICTPVCGMLHPWCTNKSPAATGADGLRKTFTSFSKQIIWNVKQVPAHRWDVSQSLQLLFLFLLRALAAADSVQKEPKCSLWQVLCVLPPLPPFQSPSNCSFFHPFKVSWAAGEKIGKGEVLQMSLLRERIANALKWTFILHRTLMES